MNKMITRAQAASILGVSKQTITNWVSEGILSGYYNENSRRLWVSEDNIREYQDQYKTIAVTKEAVERKCEELVTKESELDKQMDELLGRQPGVCHIESLTDMMHKVYMTFAYNGKQEDIVMDRVLKGEATRAVAEDMDYSMERIRQLVRKAALKFEGMMTELIKTRDENESLTKELKATRERLASALGNECLDEKNNSVSLILKKNINGQGLPNRVVKVLEAHGIQTFSDLVSLDYKDVQFMFRFGKKSLYDLTSFVERYGLEWGMKEAKASRLGKIRMNGWGKLETLAANALGNFARTLQYEYNIGKEDAEKLGMKTLKGIL